MSPITEGASMIGWIAGSNAIEGIYRPPTSVEIQEHALLLSKPHLIVADLERFVRCIASAELRRRPDMNVRVGRHVPVPGGPDMEADLQSVLDRTRDAHATPYRVHCDYEWLHPFMDGNGRSGRAVWAWQMQHRGEDPFALAFLHRFYYQTLDASR